MVAIPPSVMKRIRAHAETAYPEECCGFLVGSGAEESGESDDPTGMFDDSTGMKVRVLEELPVANAADEADRGRRFLVEPRAVLDVMKTYRDRDEELVGFYHSHPDHPAELSPTDLEFARLWPRTVWLIVPVEGGSRIEGGTGIEGFDDAGDAAEEWAHVRAGPERAWWIPGTGDRLDSIRRGPGAEQDLKPQEMTIQSSEPGTGRTYAPELAVHAGPDETEQAVPPAEDGTTTPREEKA